jgi:hypothetical protein
MRRQRRGEAVDPRDLGRELRDRIQDILDDPSMRGARLAQALDDLGGRADPGVFRTLLSMLAHFDVPEPQAHRTVVQIEEHRGALEQQLGRDPGFSVAALDFLSDLGDPSRSAGIEDAAPAEEVAAAQDGRGGDVTFLTLAAVEARRSERYRRPLAIAVLAPDGMPAGGEALRAGATALQDAARDVDIRAIPLGDGLVLILPHTDAARALLAAERLRAILRLGGGPPWSAGVAARAGPPWDPVTMLCDARLALATARQGGGDRSHPHRAERRGHPRRPVGGGLRATIHRDGGEHAVEIEDLSIGGACLRLGQRLEPGAVLRLTLREDGPRGRVATLPATTIRISEAPPPDDGPRFTAGVSFLPERGDRSEIAGLLAALATDADRDEGRR